MHSSFLIRILQNLAGFMRKERSYVALQPLIGFPFLRLLDLLSRCGTFSRSASRGGTLRMGQKKVLKNPKAAKREGAAGGAAKKAEEEAVDEVAALRTDDVELTIEQVRCAALGTSVHLVYLFNANRSSVIPQLHDLLVLNKHTGEQKFRCVPTLKLRFQILDNILVTETHLSFTEGVCSCQW